MTLAEIMDGRIQSDVIAVACSDIHLSHTPPPCRAGEDWYLAQGRTLRQVLGVCQRLNAPLLIAGDIFDRWNSPPELINFAIEIFKKSKVMIYAVPGQHDLPYHRYDRVWQSAYWSLVISGVIINVEYQREITPNSSFMLAGFPWNCPHYTTSSTQHIPKIALIHHYVWEGKNKYPDAPENWDVRAIIKGLKGYDTIIAGDNHKGFGTGRLLNCGGLMRRRSDEHDYRPAIGLIYNDGRFRRVFLDTSKETFDQDVKERETELNIGEFEKRLRELGESAMSFGEVVGHLLQGPEIGERVAAIVRECLP